MSILDDGLSRIGIDFDDMLERQINTYISELSLWKKKGLVNAEGNDLIIRHFLDCIAAFPHFPDISGKKTADLGSGAGFPGLLVALFFPDAQIDLVERQAGRAAFLTNCVSLLGLGGRVRVLESDAAGLGGGYDYFVFRAFRPFDKMTDFFRQKLAEGSGLIAYKGKAENAEQDKTLFADFRSDIINIDVPFLDEERTLLIVY